MRGTGCAAIAVVLLVVLCGSRPAWAGSRERRLMDYIKGDSFTLEGVATGKGY